MSPDALGSDLGVNAGRAGAWPVDETATNSSG